MNSIKIKNLVDYSKCPNFCKYNWNNNSLVDEKTSALRRIIKSCYRDQANLERKVVWKTVRSRVHTELSPLLENLTLAQYHSLAIETIDTLRGWYLDYYRDGPGLCLHGLALKKNIPGIGIELEGSIDALLLEENNISLVVVGEYPSNISDIYRGLELRAKAWLLSQEGVIINNFLVINLIRGRIKINKIRIDNPEDYLYKAGKTIQVIAGAIKHDVYYPSVTDMCKTCPFGSICS